jgi:hypothetical protein
MAKPVRWFMVKTVEVLVMRNAETTLTIIHWRAVCGESRKHGSAGDGWKRTQPVPCLCSRRTSSRTPAQDVPRQPPTRPVFEELPCDFPPAGTETGSRLVLRGGPSSDE